ncbi:hypothetical protein ACFE04_010060 [Oxalis oulophora]
MPGLAIDVLLNDDDNRVDQLNGPFKEQMFLKSTWSPHSPCSDSLDLAIDAVVETSIEQLYHNVCEMQSSDHSPSEASFISYGEESRIDSELRHLVGDYGDVEITKQVVVEINKEDESVDDLFPKKENPSVDHGSSAKRSSPKGKSPQTKPPIDKKSDKPIGKANAARKISFLGTNFPNKTEYNAQLSSDNPETGLGLLKQARDIFSNGGNPKKALKLARRAAKSLEKSPNGELSLELVMSLHVLAAIYSSLGQYTEAIPILERSIEIPVMEDGENHALAKFSGCMQLGDTYTMLGQMENSILFYTAGLEIQRQVLGDMNHRVGETCRYVAEAYVQAFQFDEAEKICQMALDIHKQSGSHSSIEEAADRRLMGLICESTGNYESALEHYVLASMALSSNSQEHEVASIDSSIGDVYLSLSRYDEAVFSYQKALNLYKSSKGENHHTVASVYVRLADLHNKIGKFKDSRSYCESALRIYAKHSKGIPPEEIASSLIDVAAIFQSMNELDRSLKLLNKALKLYGNAPGQQTTIAGIEAQMGVMYYMMGNFNESYNIFKSAVEKFRASGEKKTALFGIALNQLGLVCIQRYAINEAAEFFEEARSILENEYGPYHPDTLGVYSNLAGTYDAMGRLDNAIEILEYVVEMREEKLGTANPDVVDEKSRLTELLKEAGRVRNRKSRSLVTLLDKNPTQVNEIAELGDWFDFDHKILLENLLSWYANSQFRVANTAEQRFVEASCDSNRAVNASGSYGLWCSTAPSPKTGGRSSRLVASYS